jgi:sugar phosphate permease
MPNKIKMYYHWVIAGLGVLILAVYAGAANNFSSLHLIPVTETFGVTRAEFSSVQSVMNLMGIATTFFSGVIITKLGYRLVAGVSLILCAVLYFGMGFAPSFPFFLLCGAFYGILSPFCTTAGATQLVSIWFHKHRGLILGIVTSASGWGSSILCILQARIMEKTDSWRSSLLLCAALIFVLGILTLLFIRNKPDDMNLKPYGDGSEETAKRREISKEAFEGLPIGKLFCRPAFYLMILLTYLSSLLPYMVFFIFIPYLVETGLTDLQASGVNSFMLLILSGAKFATGLLCDRIGAKKVMLVEIAVSILAMILLIFTSSLPMAYLTAAVYALCLPLNTLLSPLLGFTLFGYKAQAQYTGIFLGVICFAGITGSFLPNYIFDLTGSYKPAFFGTAILGLVLLILYRILYAMTEKDKKKLAESAE